MVVTTNNSIGGKGQRSETPGRWPEAWLGPRASAPNPLATRPRCDRSQQCEFIQIARLHPDPNRESPTPLSLALSISKPRGECHCTKRIDASQIGTPRRVLAPGAVPCYAHDPRLFVGPMALDPPTAAHGMTPRGRWEEPFWKRSRSRAKPCPLTARGRRSTSHG